MAEGKRAANAFVDSDPASTQLSTRAPCGIMNTCSWLLTTTPLE